MLLWINHFSWISLAVIVISIILSFSVPLFFPPLPSLLPVEQNPKGSISFPSRSWQHLWRSGSSCIHRMGGATNLTANGRHYSCSLIRFWGHVKATRAGHELRVKLKRYFIIICVPFICRWAKAYCRLSVSYKNMIKVTVYCSHCD